MTSAKQRRASRAAENSSRAKHRRPKNGKGTGEGIRTIAAVGGCWCGEPFGHDWPGKAEDKPHPREKKA